MNDKRETFNLVDEPWIKARKPSGETVELSLRELFMHAAELRSLANDAPTQDFAILRLLIAILQRSIVGWLYERDYEYPSDAWGDLWRGGGLPSDEINSYLDEWHGCFDLLDEKQPFMQTPGLQAAKGNVGEIGKLIADYPDGLALFTMRGGRGVESLSCAEAARWLVHVHAFDPSGIKTGVVGDKAVKGGKSYPIGTGRAGGLGGVYLEGDTFAETLLLNLCLCADCRDSRDEFFDFARDLPVWERPVAGPGDEGRMADGYADIYTWQSRRVLLNEHNGRVDGVVLSNGSKIEYHNRRALEPMTAWRRSIPQEKKRKESPVYLPYSHQSNRAFWRGLSAMLPELDLGSTDAYVAPGIVLWAGFLASTNGGRQLPKFFPVRMHATGFAYGTQSSVITDMVDDSLFFSAYLLSPEGAEAAELAKKCMADTEEAVGAYGTLAGNLKLAAGLDRELLGDAREKSKSEAYFELDGPFRSWLTHLSEETDRPLLIHEIEWHETAQCVLRRLAQRLVAEADVKAIEGRKVKQGNREEWMSAGKAESRFFYQLNRALPTDSLRDSDTKKEG